MSVDEILAYLVRRTEETGIGHAITLCIGGNVVSGFMINSKKYYEIMLNYFENQNIAVRINIMMRNGMIIKKITKIL
jgi:hypothetical protein